MEFPPTGSEGHYLGRALLIWVQTSLGGAGNYSAQPMARIDTGRAIGGR